MIEQAVAHAGKPAVLSSLILLGAFYLVANFDAPVLYDEKGCRELESFYRRVHKDFQKYKGKFFKIGEQHGDTIIVPFQYLDELKSVPDTVLSLDDEKDDIFLQHYNFMSTRAVGGEVPAVVAAIKKDLTKHLGMMMSEMYEEILYSFDKELPPCDDWTEVNIGDLLFKTVAVISGRIFVGRPLNHDPEYLRCAIEFTMNVFEAIPEIRKYPPFMRWLAKYFESEVKVLHASMDIMKRLIKPSMEQTSEDIDAAPATMLTWNMKQSSEKPRNDLLVQAQMQLGDTMAAIHTTSVTTTHAMFDLAAYPEHLEALREEIAAIKAGENSPHVTKTSMPKMKKLDSFLRESQRHNIISPLNMRRKVREDIVLHDGTVLPKGAHIAFPAIQITENSDLWEDPEKFDGFRFWKLRQQPGEENKHQFVTTGERNLDFGYGIHACPGRFLASNEIKLLLIHLIENYDFKFKDGQERPLNLYTPGGYVPDWRVTLLMKKRSTT